MHSMERTMLALFAKQDFRPSLHYNNRISTCVSWPLPLSNSPGKARVLQFPKFRQCEASCHSGSFYYVYIECFSFQRAAFLPTSETPFAFRYSFPYLIMGSNSQSTWYEGKLMARNYSPFLLSSILTCVLRRRVQGYPNGAGRVGGRCRRLKGRGGIGGKVVQTHRST
jgi:hypothetical protein